uniref:Uncharacterized protein n=1 Tax=Arundo donax TaxID=35708 RepID=A0A0A9BRP3_ARUDO
MIYVLNNRSYLATKKGKRYLQFTMKKNINLYNGPSLAPFDGYHPNNKS